MADIGMCRRVIGKKIDAVVACNCQVEPAIVVVVAPAGSHAVDAQIGKFLHLLKAAVAQVAIQHGRRELRDRHTERAAAADDKQIIEAIIIEVTPSHSRTHVFGQLRRPRTRKLTEQRKARCFVTSVKSGAGAPAEASPRV